MTNYETLDHSWLASSLPYLNNKNEGVVLDGFGGDVLSESKIVKYEFHNLYLQGRFEELAEEIISNSEYINSFYSGSFIDKYFYKSEAKSTLVKEFERYRDCHNPMQQFYFWNRSRRSIATSSVRYLSAKHHVYLPFIGKELYCLLVSMPADKYFKDNEHMRLLSEKYLVNDSYGYAGSINREISSSKSRHLTDVLKGVSFLINNRHLFRFNIKTIARLFLMLFSRKRGQEFMGILKRPIYVSQISKYK